MSTRKGIDAFFPPSKKKGIDAFFFYGKGMDAIN